MIKKLAFAAFCIGLASSLGAASAAQPTPVPDTMSSFGPMSFYLGTWNCHSITRGSNRPDTVTNTMDYDGRWMKGHDVAPPFDKYRKRAVVTDSWTNFNPSNHLWVSTSVDNFGGYGIATSPGWMGNRITWTTTVSQDGSTGRDVVTKISNTMTRDTYTGRNKDGSMQPVVTTMCTKQHASAM